MILRDYWHGVTGLLFVAIRSFCGTMLLMLCLGVVLAVSTYFLLAQYQPLYGLIGGVVAMLEAVIVGFVWGGKRAVIMTLVYGLSQFRIGKATVRLIFERLLGMDGQHSFGERGGMVARAVERIPLAQAEKQLRAVVNDLLNRPGENGGILNWAKRWLQGRLLRYVETFTLARFRESGTEQGGVDLCLVQTDLENRLDDMLVAKMRKGLNLWTLLVLVGLPVQIFATVYIVMALLK